MQEMIYWFIIFIFYSFCGWLIETSLSVFENKKFINRGFLIGPYCPIYGIGALCMILVLKKYTNDYIALFIIGTALCSFVEYSASLILEKIFKARWWDYSHIIFNVNGRICLIYSLLFGLGGLFLLNFNPLLIKFLKSLSVCFFNTISTTIMIIFITDLFISINIIKRLKLATLEYNKDNTEEITEKISSILKRKSNQFKRLLLAFPNIIIKTETKKPKKKS